MALRNCRECGVEVSDKAKICPRCGIKNPVKRTSIVTKILAVIIGLPILIAVLGKITSNDKDSATSSSATPAAQATATQADQLPKTPWQYTSNPDSMGKGTVYYAANVSTNTLDFKFPYTGEQHATLTLRKHPRQGNDVLFSIERGQFVCMIDRCSVLVRFDDGESVRFNAVEPSDHSTTALFLTPFDKFYSRMQKAKRVRIQADFYQEGSRTLDFDVAGFEAAKLSAPK